MKILNFLAILLLFWVLMALYANVHSISSHSPSYSFRMRLSALKTAFNSYRADIGLFPFSGDFERDPEAYDTVIEAGMSVASEGNCLFTEDIAGFLRMGINEHKYQKDWKGPYLEGDCEEYFLDHCGRPVIYFRWGNGLYIWSAGDDHIFDPVVASFSNFLECSSSSGSQLTSKIADLDDIVIQIGRFRRSLLQDPDLQKRIARAYAVCPIPAPISRTRLVLDGIRDFIRDNWNPVELFKKIF